MLAVIDQYIPFLSDALQALGIEVLSMAPEQIDRNALLSADALFVRTRTKVDARLLEGTPVRFVATATIGTDHLDIPYLSQKGIAWTSAPGCNAQAVCDYIEEAIRFYCQYRAMNTKEITLGIVGCGHVGSKVQAMAEAKGMRILVSDPPKGIHTPLADIAHLSDIITFHTPLYYDGPYKTFHLCDHSFLQLCRPHTLIINAARGGVIDEKALLASSLPCVIDTWESEPDIHLDVLQRALLASYHIAGYSQQGKFNATQQVIDAFCHHFALPSYALDPSLQIGQGDSQSGWLERITLQLKQHPHSFEQLRKQYLFR